METSDSKTRLWGVTVPIAGHAYVVVEADSEEEAVEKAVANCERDDIEQWGALEQFNQGNICYCPHPWQAEAVDETPDDWQPSAKSA